ncbi:hypothetical protein BCR32DRAFT_280188 [Anaeromyces robustus]|uniref:Uncharacterized protein n=1 Tax=Anaeromyces robustus TaxID=1754192 RepID=A0A1Y1X6G4_9FUNG|nr:hypothetical protein BCR32DRAFT_280188 [Anaeromyces robustus]|eukprot:ORX80884.1 hypothetical protein BCR32DRAFT_280188 [Anaeromyces robustus]
MKNERGVPDLNRRPIDLHGLNGLKFRYVVVFKKSFLMSIKSEQSGGKSSIFGELFFNSSISEFQF